MPAVWTTPPTFTPGQIVSASDFNKYIRDNPLYFFGRPFSYLRWDNNASVTTTSTSFTPIDSANFKITITPRATLLLVGFRGLFNLSNTAYVKVDIEVDGVRIGAGGADGLGAWGFGNVPGHIQIVEPIQVTADAQHTIRPVWASSSSAVTATLYAGNGTGGQDYLPSIWALEVSNV
jgi:hypothetical protein